MPHQASPSSSQGIDPQANRSQPPGDGSPCYRLSVRYRELEVAMESPTPDVIMTEMERVLQAFGGMAADPASPAFSAVDMPTRPDTTPSLPSYNSGGASSGLPPRQPNDGVMMPGALAEPAHITTPTGLSLTAERMMPPAPVPNSPAQGRQPLSGRGLDAVVQSLFSVFAPHARPQEAPVGFEAMAGEDADNLQAREEPAAWVSNTPQPAVAGPSLADLEPVASSRHAAVATATAEEEEVVEFSTLGELLEEFEETSPLVELLAAAFYLTSQNQQASYAFRELNIALMRDKRQPVPHAVLDEALQEGYLRELPADDASATKPNYCLTEAGRLYLEGQLV